ncbi:MAG TPA: amidohydrolase family protein [Actinokineospora sp.]|nr:amidohydrolase family protein [Actinokineospora sp.]
MTDHAPPGIAHGPVRLDQRPGVEVVDSHLHLWDRRRHEYPWLDRLAHLGVRVNAALLAETVTGLAGAVFVEAAAAPADSANELRWLAAEADRCAFPVRIVVGHVPGDPAWWLGRPGADLVTGVRRRMHLAQPGEIAAPEFRAFALAAGESGLVVDLVVRAEQLDEVDVLCRKTPGTRFVLDHLGNLAPGSEGFDAWATGIGWVAENPNVSCKLSPIAVRPGDPPFLPQVAARYLAHALNSFGADRCLYGTDWPVLTHTIAFGAWLDLVRYVLGEATAADRHAVLAGNARQLYGLPVPVTAGAA